ncbi:MAG: PQQ-binding-like beta-propeller repeat protein [Planctomycetota bacterium]|nr:PQQ-binding-like beta-propeller repeat protein [Planctomycetota bacterium]
MTQTPDNATDARLARARYQAALATAVVAGILCALVAGALAIRHLRATGEHLSTSEEIARLRDTYLTADDPDRRAEIAEAIRRRDYALRRRHSGRLTFTRVGGLILVAGAVVFLVAAARVVALRKRLPHPPRAEERAPPDVTAPVARWTVVGLTASLIGLGIFLYALTGEGYRAQPPETGQAAAIAVGPPPPQEEIVRHWPRFRGPDGNAHSRYTNVPASWNGASGENVLWKTEVPLPGPNSPVLWGNRVFLSGATRQKREVFCFDADTGRLLWTRPVGTPAGSMTEPPKIMEATGYASPTCATDGRYVCAIFANADLGCFTADGKEVWVRNLGRFKNTYGFASSLVTYRDTLLVQADEGAPDQGYSRLLALDLRTGRTAWEAPRPVGSSWTTPVIARTGARAELITCANPLAIAYNPDDGKELWRADVLAGDVAPSPIWHDGLAFAVNTGAVLAAIRMGGSGNVTESGVAWTGEDGLPDIVSPLSDGRIVLLCTTDGFLNAYAVADGKLLWQKELDRRFNASPSLVGDTVYLLDAKGVMHLATIADGFKEVATAELGEPARASPAFADGRIYLRGRKHLFCIGEGVGATQESVEP